MFAIGALAVGSRPPQQQRSALLVGGLILVVLIGLRFRVGCDWSAYVYLFRSTQFASFSAAVKSSDPAYGALEWIVGQWGLGVWAVNLICALIFTVGLVSFCRWQPNPPLAMLVAVPYLVIVVAMGYTRQSAALGFVMIALSEFRRRSIVGILVSLTLAILFHKSAILIIPVVGLAYSRNVILSAFVFGILGYTLYHIFVERYVPNLVAGYVTSSYGSSGAMVRVSMNLVPALLFLLLRKKFALFIQDSRLWVIFSLASIAAFSVVIYSPAAAAVDRAALYLIPLQVFVLSRVPVIFAKMGRQSMLFVSFIVAYSFAVELVWLNFGLFSRCWIPYESYLWV